MREVENNGGDWEAVERGEIPMKWLREKQYDPLGWEQLRSQPWAGTTRNRGWWAWAHQEPRTSRLDVCSHPAGHSSFSHAPMASSRKPLCSREGSLATLPVLSPGPGSSPQYQPSLPLRSASHPHLFAPVLCCHLTTSCHRRSGHSPMLFLSRDPRTWEFFFPWELL